MPKADFPWANSWPEITDERVRSAFTKVHRQGFVDKAYQEWADRDAPLPIGEGQTISQPYVVALMTQACNVQLGDRVLEIGAGSGYQTAILCEMTGVSEHNDRHSVYSVELRSSLADEATQRLAAMGYSPHIGIGDGAAGWPKAMTFDAIVVTAAAKCLPKPLWEQLADGGRMTIPIGGRFAKQTLWLIEKKRGMMRQTSLGPVRFVPLVSHLLDDPNNCIKLST